MRSILVAVDFSDVSCRALELGASLAAAFNSRLDVLHATFIPAEDAVDALELLSESMQTNIDGYRKALRQEAMLRLSELVKSHVPQGVDVRIRLEHGEPWKIIGKAARVLNSNVVVMGTVARAGIPGMLFGNTAEKVVRTCNRSILAVKPEGFVSPIQPAFWSLYPTSIDTSHVEGMSET